MDVISFHRVFGEGSQKNDLHIPVALPKFFGSLHAGHLQHLNIQDQNVRRLGVFKQQLFRGCELHDLKVLIYFLFQCTQDLHYFVPDGFIVITDDNLIMHGFVHSFAGSGIVR